MTHLTAKLYFQPTRIWINHYKKFKIKLQKDITQVGEILILITGDKYCHGQGLCSAIYDLISIQYGKLSFLLIVNGDKRLVR